MECFVCGQVSTFTFRAYECSAGLVVLRTMPARNHTEHNVVCQHGQNAFYLGRLCPICSVGIKECR